MDSSRKFLVCTVYDVLAKEHCPPFIAVNMGVLWRNVDELAKKASFDVSQLVVCVHGSFDLEDAFEPLKPDSVMYFTVSREPLSWKQVELMIKEAV